MLRDYATAPSTGQVAVAMLRNSVHSTGPDARLARCRPRRHAIHFLQIFMNTSNRVSATRRLLPLLLLPMATLALAQQHAHTHGRLALDVTVDAQNLTLSMEAPLDNLLGFERAPRTDAERKRVAEMIRRLNAADKLFLPDPRAECRLSSVTLESRVLGLGTVGIPTGAMAETRGNVAIAHDDHADIDVAIVFSCANAARARQVEVRMFDAFPRLRDIDAQVASDQGQFKRSLNKAAPMLRWGR
jgi:hypothetical protein